MPHLSHHGIKGQHWGTRNGPPYPLNEEGKRNFRYNRAKRDAKTAKQVCDAHSNYSVGSLSTMTTTAGEKFVSGLTSGHDFDWMEASLGTDDIYRPAASYHEQFKESDIYRSGGLIDESYVRSINPGFGEAGTTQNCAKCAAALELMYQGYDGFKAGRQTYPSSSNAPEFWFDGAEEIMYNTPSSADHYLRSYGAGASGTLSMQYPEERGGGGHALHWAIGSYGQLRIEDGQTGECFKSMEEVNGYYGFNGGSVSTYRLDNCKPNWDHMASDSVVRLLDDNSKYNKVFNRHSGRIVDTW